MNTKHRTLIIILTIANLNFTSAWGLSSKEDQKNVEIKALKASVHKQGTFVLHLEEEPVSLDPLSSEDKSADSVIQFMCDSLLRRDPSTYDWIPGIAEKYEISKDKKTVTFIMRPNLTFHDGKSVSAEDVKFTVERLQDRTKKFLIPQMGDFFSSLNKIEVLDPKTLRIEFSNVNFKNFETLSSLPIVSKSYYQNRKISSISEPPGRCSGPYRPLSFKDHKLYLEFFPEWYGTGDSQYKNRYNFANVIFQFSKRDGSFLKHLKKGEIDFVELSSSEIASGKWNDLKKFPKMERVQTENKLNRKYDFIAWNLRSPLFQDRDTRLALNYLMDRSQLNKKFRKGLSSLAVGPVSSLSDYANSAVSSISYNKETALQYLKKAGWVQSGKDALLQKKVGNEKIEFRFTLHLADPSREAYFADFQQELKTVGIQMVIKKVEWYSLLEELTEGKFDSVYMAWEPGQGEPDPYILWHSDSAKSGGKNFIGYKNPVVDKLIEQARQELDRSSRVKIMQDLYQKIAEDAPYLFLFTELNYVYLVNKHIKRPADSAKYDLGISSWSTH